MIFLRTDSCFKRLVVGLLTVTILSQNPSLVGAPLYNYHDPLMVHTVMGSDKYYQQREHAGFSFHISPFYTHTASANKPGGTKTAAGNVNGPWDMLGMFYNNPARFPTKLNAILVDLRGMDPTPDLDFTIEAEHDPSANPGALGVFDSVQLKFEKMGLRSQLSLDFAFGLGAAVKGGVADIRNSPKSFIPHNFFSDLAAATSSTPIAGPTYLNPDAKATFYNDLLSPTALQLIARALNIDLLEYRKTALEDTHVDIHWGVPVSIKDGDVHSFTIIPYLSLGAWIPTGQIRDQKKIFSVPTGNDGHAALTLDGSINFDFPDTVQVGVGGGIAVFNPRNFSNFRVPTSMYQIGILPWTTDINRKPGPLWYFNVSMKADNFLSKKHIPNVSCYVDYVFVEHLKDSITINSSSASNRFKPEVLENQSAWKSQHLFGGMRFALSKNVFVGGAVQATIGGSQTLRPTTVLGSLIIMY